MIRDPIQQRVFLWGFGLSCLSLAIEYLTEGRFPAWVLLALSNPTIVLAAFVGHRVEEIVGSRWADEAYFATLAADSVLWWYLVAVLTTRLRRSHRA
jgi:hypothetical protein